MNPEVFPRRSSRGVLAGLSLSQLVVLGIPLLMMLFALVSDGLGSAVQTGVLLLVAVPAAFIRVGTRRIVDWIPTMFEFQWKKWSKQNRYQRQLLAPREEGFLGLPGEGAALRLIEDAETSSALVWDKNAGTLVAVAALEHGQFLSLSDEDREGLSNGWGMAMSQISNIEGVARFQILSRSLPDGGSNLERAYEEARDPGRAGSIGDDLYRQVLAQSAARMRRHETYLAVAVSRGRAGSLVKEHGGGLTGLAAVLGEARGQVEAALRQCGVSVDMWLPKADLARLIRTAYDPAALEVLEAHEDLGTMPAFAGPITVDEGWARMRADSGFFQTWRINAWPRVATTAGFLRPLLMDARDGQTTFSMMFEPIPTDKALAKAQREVAAEETARIERGRRGQIDTVLNARERSQAMQHLDDIAAGHMDMSFCGLVTVGGQSVEELRRVSARVRAAAISKNIDMKVSYGQQSADFLTGALPLCRKAW